MVTESPMAFASILDIDARTLCNVPNSRFEPLDTPHSLLTPKAKG